MHSILFNGGFMIKTNKSVVGVGINNYNGSMKDNGKNIPSYVCWTSMLKRCYSDKYQSKQPTYIGCSVCEEWLLFSNFKKWYDANYKEGFHLDKDILVEGNKIYSPENCVFVPQYLNSLLNDNKSSRGDLPLGVSRNNNSYVAKCLDGSGGKLRKTFKTIKEAVEWYAETKKRVVIKQVNRALAECAIDQEVANALLSREFSKEKDIMSFGDSPYSRSK